MVSRFWSIIIYDLPFQKKGKEENKEGKKKSKLLMQNHFYQSALKQPKHSAASQIISFSLTEVTPGFLQNKANSEYIIVQHCFKINEIQQYNS